MKREMCIKMQRLTNFQELETAINENGEMVVVKNSKNNLVLMSVEEYKKKMMRNDIVK